MLDVRGNRSRAVGQTLGNQGDQKTAYVYKLTGWEAQKTVRRLEPAPTNWEIKVQSDRDYYANAAVGRRGLEYSCSVASGATTARGAAL